jgi:hypothetical protein
MNATPQCYDYEVGSPGWGFFRGGETLPDNRLGIAQLSNRLLIPPDALPFEGHPNGKFLVRLQGLAGRRSGLLGTVRQKGRLEIRT